MEPTEARNPLTLPAAIVVAGLIIAGAIFITKNPAGERGNQKEQRAAAAGTAAVLPAVEVGTDDHTLGNPSAPIIVIEYSDAECPFCKSFHATMQSLMSTYGKRGELAWVYRHFPLDSLHPKARKEAEALECAAEQGGNAMFWQYTNRLMSITPSNNQLDPAELPRIALYVGLAESAFSDCLASGRYAARVQDDYADAIAHGGRGTPFNIIKVNAPLPAETRNTLATELTALTGETPSFMENDTAFSVSGAIPLKNMVAIMEILTKNEP